jgi:hypothetical protein
MTEGHFLTLSTTQAETLACLGLFIGARRWLGRFGGLAAVGLYCSSGAALAFAWRDYMPTFTDASLIAAGSGALLWAMLATEASLRRRTWAGLAGFAAIEIASRSRCRRPSRESDSAAGA